MADVSRLSAMERLAQLLYELAAWLAIPFARIYVRRRAAKEPLYRQHLHERLARYSRKVENSRSAAVWIHAVSVGEVRAAAPLVHALARRYPEGVMLTYMTPTGRSTGEDLFNTLVHHALLPWDSGPAMRRFFRHYRPQLGILIETEVWPNLLKQAEQAGVPIALVNGRLSERSLMKTLRLRWLARPAYARLSLVLAQSENDAVRFKSAGARRVIISGNLKFELDLDVAQLSKGARDRAIAAAAGLTTVLLASTREGEEALLLRALGPMLLENPQLRLCVVPRHPQRFDEVHALLQQLGLGVARHSVEPEGFAHARVALGDTMGQMAHYLGSADIVVVGGGWLPHGGSNPIEPCVAASAVIVGPSMFNFAQATALGAQADALIQLQDVTDLPAAIMAFAKDPEKARQSGRRARAFAAQHRGALQRTLQALEPYLAVRSK